MSNKFPLAILATSVLCAPVFSQDAGLRPAQPARDSQGVDLSAWDENHDGMVSQEEWAEAFASEGIFDQLDENNNGIFDVEESNDDLFEYDLSWDLDDGGHIERQEFLLGAFNEYDEDGDDRLDAQEFNAFVQDYRESDLSDSDVASN